MTRSIPKRAGSVRSVRSGSVYQSRLNARDESIIAPQSQYNGSQRMSQADQQLDDNLDVYSVPREQNPVLEQVSSSSDFECSDYDKDDIEDLKKNYIECHNRYIKKHKFYAFLAEQNTWKEMWVISGPLLILNAVNTFLTTLQIGKSNEADTNSTDTSVNTPLSLTMGNDNDNVVSDDYYDNLDSLGGDSQDFNPDSGNPLEAAVFWCRKILPVILTFFTGLQVLKKYGRKSEKFISSSNMYKSLASDCYFKLQKLDMYFLFKEDREKIAFIVSQTAVHNRFMDDAKKREEHANKEAYVIRKSDIQAFERKFQKELNELLKHENDENDKAMHIKYALHGSYMKLDNGFDRHFLGEHNMDRKL